MPAGVDSYGEDGAFHSYVFDGPGFRHPILYMVGERSWEGDRFCRCGLVPGSG